MAELQEQHLPGNTTEYICTFPESPSNNYFLRLNHPAYPRLDLLPFSLQSGEDEI